MRAVLATLCALVLAASARLDKHSLARRNSSHTLTRRNWSSYVEKGLIVSDADEFSVWKSHSADFSLAVNYQSSLGSIDLTSGISFVPYRRTDESASTFTLRAEAAIALGAKYISDINEPNESGVDGETGAKNWKEIIEPILKKHTSVKGIAGQISANDEGLQYFRKACSDCQIDAYGFHWYNREGRSVDEGISKLEEWIEEVKDATGSAVLWVTEFGSRSTSSSEQCSFIKKAVALFRKTCSIQAIFGFSHLDDGPYVDDGSLTDAGRAYLDA